MSANPVLTIIMFFLFLIIVGQLIYGITHKIIRCINIKNHGYPPFHCDGDGDPINKIIEKIDVFISN